ncbi:MAG: putative manganese transporter [Emergencia sp.]
MFEIIVHTLLHSLEDSVSLIPFLFLTYLAMGILERAASDRPQKIISQAGRFGPVWGAVIGAFPQCGLSAAASYFYIGRVLNLGTLIAIYMSTSDEMLPILISEKAAVGTILRILAVKAVIGMISGFLVEFLFGWLARRHRTPKSFEHQRDCETCCCGGGIVLSALVHTLKVFFFVLLISFAVGIAIEIVGEQNLAMIFSNVPVLGEAVSALVGLIPNCAASVVITQLYLDGIIGAGPMMSGLLVSAGVGLLVLFKENRHPAENIIIAGILYAVSVAWGVVITVSGISF